MAKQQPGDSEQTLAAFDYGGRVFAGGEAGRVHSVFVHGFNLALADRLVHVALGKASLHPHMVGMGTVGVLPDGSRPVVGDGVVVDAAAKTLRITGRGRLLIDCSGAQERPTLALAASRLTPTQLSQLTAARDREKLTRDLGSPVWQHKIDQHLTAYRTTGNTEAFRPLVGFGPGLTPSGDDVLVGLLAAFESRRDLRARELRQLIRAESHATTAVSRDLLLAATEGAYGFALVELANAPPDLDPAALDRLVANLCAWGSTSGLDTLTGFVCGILEP